MLGRILTKTDLETFFDENAKEVINFFLFKAIFAQPEIKSGQNALPIQIPKEHIEQWGVQALEAKPTGAGSYPIDFIDLKKGYGADIKMLSWSNKTERGGEANGQSGETSLAQKFSDENLDRKFVEQQYQEIIDAWKGFLKEKFKKVFDDHPDQVTDINYFFLIREKDEKVKGDNKGKKFHICGMQIDISKFDELELNPNVNEENMKTSIWVNNFIDEEYGDVKIYKAKKRMELRLRPRKWIDDEKVITFDFDKLNDTKKDLLNLSNEERYKFSIQEFKRIYELICGYKES